MEALPAVVQRESLKLAIVTVPARNAQAVTDQLIHAGIAGILNFAPVTLNVPPTPRSRRRRRPGARVGTAHLCCLATRSPRGLKVHPQVSSLLIDRLLDLFDALSRLLQIAGYGRIPPLRRARPFGRTNRRSAE